MALLCYPELSSSSIRLHRLLLALSTVSIYSPSSARAPSREPGSFRGHPDISSPSLKEDAGLFNRRLVTLLLHKVTEASCAHASNSLLKHCSCIMSSLVSGPADVRTGPADLEPPSEARKAFVSHSL